MRSGYGPLQNWVLTGDSSGWLLHVGQWNCRLAGEWGGGPSPSDMACGHSRAQRSQPFNWEGQEKHGPCPLHRVSPSPLHHMSPLCSASPPHPLHQVPPTL